jgi:cytochrome P450
MIVHQHVCHPKRPKVVRPLEFDPGRFIKNSEINSLGSHFQFIPFGTGRRQCPGMLLALLFVQVGLACLTQSLDFALPNGQDPATLDMLEKFGVTMPRQNPLHVVCKTRLPKYFCKGN